MKQVYAPANVAEAHMLVHMLGEHDILAHIHGEALQGGVGELPAGLLQVAVADEDYDEARRLIEAWEKSDTPTQIPKPTIPFISGLLIFALGLLGGWGLHVAAVRNAIPIDSDVQRLDLNGDGQSDWSYYYRVGAMYPYRGEGDRNFDGAIDQKQRYDQVGTLVSAESDDNFDRFFETRTRFRAGNTLQSDVDANSDGIVDRKLFFSHGVLVREEIFADDPQRPVRVDHYNNLRLDRAEIDADRDGFFETIRTIDQFGEITATETRTRP